MTGCDSNSKAGSPVHGLSCSDKVCAGVRQPGVLCFRRLELYFGLIAQGPLELGLALILCNDLHKTHTVAWL